MVALAYLPQEWVNQVLRLQGLLAMVAEAAEARILEQVARAVQADFHQAVAVEVVQERQ